MSDNAGLYQRALPFWVALTVITTVLNPLHAISRESMSGGRLLAGIEPIIVLKALFQRPEHLGQVILCYGLPTLARRAGEQDPHLGDDPSLPEAFWAISVGVRYHTPQETLRAGLPILGFRQMRPVPPVELASQPRPIPSPAPQPLKPPPTVPDSPRTMPRAGKVIIFHTHTSESYLPISGRNHLENGAGDIVQVGDYLAQSLETEGFSVVHDRTLHDLIPFRDAYRRSSVTAEKLLRDNPEPLALIDLHRDATPGVAGTIELGGEKVARLVLVVGTDRLGLSHPRWRENLAFANSLRDAAERLYPSLLARIDLADARYNQHLFDRSIIVEVGNQHSTALEVYRAAACLAKILAEVAGNYPTAAPAVPSTGGAPPAAPPTRG